MRRKRKPTWFPEIPSPGLPWRISARVVVLRVLLTSVVTRATRASSSGGSSSDTTGETWDLSVSSLMDQRPARRCSLSCEKASLKRPVMVFVTDAGPMVLPER
jgi:hypothetical protein